jgi:hypothetical protein
MQTKFLKNLTAGLPSRLSLVSAALAGALLAGCAAYPSGKDGRDLEAARVSLMEAAITRDQSVIQPLLAPDFAWREDTAPLDEEPYDFWSRHKLWADFGTLLKAVPVRRESLMVAPKESLRESYKGPRLAWRKVGVEWRLAYFYPGTALLD